MRTTPFRLLRSALFLPLLAGAILLAAAAPAAAQGTSEASELPRLMVHLLDYIGRDYGVAVQDGQVISAPEYEEQQEFVATVRKSAGEVEALRNDAAFLAELEALGAAVDAKVPPEEIAERTGKLRDVVLERTGIPMAPTEWPDMKVAARLYAGQCASCHGVEGRGDGPDGAGLEPAPASFRTEDAKSISPFQYFNTIRNGVQGTGMPAFPQLTDEEAWSLAFYITGMKYQGRLDAADYAAIDVGERTLPNLNDLAVQNDRQLAAALGGEDDPLFLALRLDPARFLASRRQLDLALSQIDKTVGALRGGNDDEARSLALSAYLDGIEPFEARLRARDANIVVELEAAMMGLRNAVESGDVERTEIAAAEARKTIRRAESLLGGDKLSFGMTALAALLILLREGFEAVLVVVALLAVLRRMQVPRARHWTHAGWIAAIAAGILTWVLSDTLLDISGAGREVLEGVVGLLAVVVLLFVGLWLHGQGEIQKWAAFVNQRARQAVRENRFYTFAGIAFLAVYREVFETVLFYRALSLEAGEGTGSALLLGFVVGLVGIAIMTWAMLRLGARLPLQRFFQLSAGLILLLSVVLLGKGIHSLQEAGLISVTSLPVNLRAEILGIFPTVESFLAQVALAVFLFVLWHLRSRRQRRAVGAPA